MATVIPVSDDPHGKYIDKNHGMSEAQHKGAKNHWKHVQAEVKVGMFAKASKHKHKIAACHCTVIGVVVLIVVLTTAAVAAAVYKNQDKLCSKGYTKFCPKPEPKANTQAGKAFQFGKVSVIPPKHDSRRRLSAKFSFTQAIDKLARDITLRGAAKRNGRKLAIDTATFTEDSDYNMATTTFFVSEESAEAMNMVSMIMCDVAQLRAAYFVNQGPYKAQVDESKCVAKGSMMEWTVDVTTVGAADSSNTLTCAGDNEPAVNEKGIATLTCGWNIDIWFQAEDGMPINVQMKIWKPVTMCETNCEPSMASCTCDPIPRKELQFKAGPVDMGGGTMVDMLGILHQTENGDRDESIKFGQFMSMGDQSMTQGAIHCEYNTGTGAGKVWSQSTEGGPGSNPTTFKLAFDGTYVKKDKDGTEQCLDMSDPKEVGSQYQLYDNTGKAVIFEEGFPIEAESADGTKYEAWAGYHGLHVHSRGDEDSMAQSLFADGKKVNKINYDADSSRTPYTLKVDNGRLMKVSRKTITLGELTGVTMQVGWGSDVPRIMFNGTKLMKVGAMGGMCFAQSNNGPPTLVNGPTDQFSCMCQGRSSGQLWDGSNMWMETFQDISNPTPFEVSTEAFPWGVDVSAGEGSGRFHGRMKLEVDQILRMWIAGPSYQGGTYIEGQNITQGNAVGVVYTSTPLSFTGITKHYNHAEYRHSQDCSGAKEAISWMGDSVFGGTKLIQDASGATGIVKGHGNFGWRIQFETTSGTFVANQPVRMVDPTELSGEFKHFSVNGSFTPTAINQQGHELLVKVTSGTFAKGDYDPVQSAYVPAADIYVAGINQNDLWGFHRELGKLKNQPNANTEIIYTTRKLVFPDDTVPALKCYDRCPKATGLASSCSSEEECYEGEPGILADVNVDNQGSGCVQGNLAFAITKGSGTFTGASITGAVDSNGKLVSAEVETVGNGCTSDDSISVTVSGCTSAPTVSASCRTGTDDSTTYGQAKTYTYDGYSLKDGNGVSVTAAENSQLNSIHSGILFELTNDAKVKGKCEHDTSQVCYHDLREKLDTYYEWETRSAWSKRVSLIDDDSGTSVKFDQPISVSYTHSGTESNSGKNYHGTKILLSYENELRGFPQLCLDKTTLEKADCAPDWSGITRNMPDFTVPDNAIFTSTDTGTEYVAKAGEVEQIMKMASSAASCSSLDTTTVPAPVTIDLYQSFELGSKPDLSDKPTVVFSGMLLKELEEIEAEKAAASE